jgi:hypothetical protein
LVTKMLNIRCRGDSPFSATTMYDSHVFNRSRIGPRLLQLRPDRLHHVFGRAWAYMYP